MPTLPADSTATEQTAGATITTGAAGTALAAKAVVTSTEPAPAA